MSRPLEVVGGALAERDAAAPSARRALVVELRDATGRVGLGEASPLPRYSPDDLDAARASLGATPWRDLPPVPLEGDVHGGISAALDARGVESPAARFALECALLDLAGQATRRPAWRLLAPGAPAPSPVPYAALLPVTLEPADLVEAARAATARGVTALKVKIGRPGAFDQELVALESVRLAIGDGVALRLDANGTLVAGLHGDREAALLRRLEALAALRPEYVEEPVAVETLLLSRAGVVPFALDETLQRPDAPGLLDRALATGACRAVVLKPMALGGLDRCLAFAGRARAAGAAAVASHLFDGPIAFAANAALAVALAAAGERLAAGLAPHAGLAAGPGPSVIEVRDGRLAVPVAPGLGLTAAHRVASGG